MYRRGFKKNKMIIGKMNELKTIIKRHPKRSFELLFFLIIGITVALSLSPIFKHQGWPQNHEGLSFVLRTKIYAEHFIQGDLFPIWASSDAYGLGTPLPLYYHKTFYYLSGSLLALLSSVKLAIWFSLAVFMFIGAYGMRFCSQKLDKGNAITLIASVLFIISNYAFSNWLVRGAMAEFTAMMIVPWVLWWCLNLITSKKLSYAIIPIVYFLFQAHNITALFSIIPITFACSYFIRHEGKKSLSPAFKFVLVSTIALTLLLLPQLVLQAIFLQDYDPSKITQMGFQASENFRPLRDYILGTDYVWLNNWQELNVSLDRFVWLVIITGALVLLTQIIHKKTRHITIKKLQNPSILFLVSSIIIFMFLQCSVAGFVYKSIPPLQFLQFPWRLLAYITPLSILLCVAVLGLVLNRNKHILYIIMILVVVGTLSISPIINHFKYAFFDTATINGRFTVKELGSGSDLLGIGEYLPTVEDNNGTELSTGDTTKLYYGLTETKFSQTDNRCTVVESKPRQRFESLKRVFLVRCKSPGNAYLPVSYSALTKVYIKRNINEKLRIIRIKNDPRVVVYVGFTGEQEITVELPRIGNIL